MRSRVNEAVQTHYTRADLGDAILAALESAGKDVNRLTPEDLAPIDEFHIRGRAATLELAGAAGLDATKRVLDVGCGVGGTLGRSGQLPTVATSPRIVRTHCLQDRHAAR